MFVLCIRTVVTLEPNHLFVISGDSFCRKVTTGQIAEEKTRENLVLYSL